MNKIISLKKIFAVLLVVSVVFSTLSSQTFAAPKLESREIGTYGDYLFEMEAETTTYSKMKITNTKNGEVEYLQTYTYADGSTYSIAESATETYTVASNNKELVVRDNRGQVISRTNFAQQKLYSNTLSGALRSPTMGTMAVGAWGNWVTTKGDYATNFTLLSLYVAAIAKIFGIPSSYPAVVSAASTAYSLLCDNIYYKHVTRCRSNGAYYIDFERNTYLYSVSNYTGLIGQSFRAWTDGI